MKVAIDRHAYVDLCRGVAATVRLLEAAETVVVPGVVLAELRAAFALGPSPADDEGVLRRFLLKDGVRVFHPDEQTTHYYASLYRQLRQQGTPLPANEIWVAALVLQHNLVLHSRDRHFDHLPQIIRV
jgi:predicted nucleic acid-binding protein